MLNNKFDRIYVGWLSEAHRPDVFPAPKAPANYKDPEKIREYIDRASVGRDELIAVTPGGLKIKAIQAIDTTGETIFGSVSDDVVIDFLSFLKDRVEGFSVDERHTTPTVFALRAVALITAMAYSLWETDFDIGMPVASWLQNHHDPYKSPITDPYAVLVNHESKPSVWSDRYNTVPAPKLEFFLKTFFPDTKFVSDAEIVKALCDRMRL